MPLFIRLPFFLQTPVEHSERVAGCSLGSRYLDSQDVKHVGGGAGRLMDVRRVLVDDDASLHHQHVSWVNFIWFTGLQNLRFQKG